MPRITANWTAVRLPTPLQHIHRAFTVPDFDLARRVVRTDPFGYTYVDACLTSYTPQFQFYAACGYNITVLPDAAYRHCRSAYRGSVPALTPYRERACQTRTCPLLACGKFLPACGMWLLVERSHIPHAFRHQRSGLVQCWMPNTPTFIPQFVHTTCTPHQLPYTL